MKLALQPRQAEPASATAETAAASPSPGSPRLPSLLSCLVHPAVSVGIILASVALAVWILSVRLPVLRKPLPVQARASGTGDSPKAVPTEVLAEWRVRGQAARERLLGSQQELIDFLAEAERLAVQWGWRAEVSVRPGPAVSEAAEKLAGYLVWVRLEQAALTPTESSAYLRLLELVRQIDFTQPKASLTDLQITAGEAGISVAQLEFRFWAALPDEKTAAK